MSHMVVRRYNKSCIHKCDYHMEVAPRMLSEAVDQLDNSSRLTGRDIDPALDQIPLIK